MSNIATNKSPMNGISIRLPGHWRDALRALGQKQGLSEAATIRQLLSRALNTEAKQ